MFDYLLDRIKNASFTEEPFRHIYLDKIFKEDDFEKIVMSEEIKLKNVPLTQKISSLIPQEIKNKLKIRSKVGKRKV